MNDWTIEVAAHEHSNIRELVVSYLRALERFRAEDALSGPGDHQLANESRGRAALAETLNWADAIDNYLRAGPKESKPDSGWADKLPADDKELLMAFQRVRNVVHHRWWEAVNVRLEPRESGQANVWVWGHLPTASRSGKGRDAQGDAAFAKRIEGHHVLETLDQLAAIFWTKRRWEIRREDLEQPGQTVGAPLNLDG